MSRMILPWCDCGWVANRGRSDRVAVKLMEWSAAFTRQGGWGYKLRKRRSAMELFTLGIDLGRRRSIW